MLLVLETFPCSFFPYAIVNKSQHSLYRVFKSRTLTLFWLCWSESRDKKYEQNLVEKVSANWPFGTWSRSRDIIKVVVGKIYYAGYGLDDRGSRVRFSVRAGNFSLYHRTQNGSGGSPSLLSNGYQGLFPCR
jgi:hypothetical protein